MKSAEYAARFGMGYVFGQFMSDADGTEAVRRYREGFMPSATMKEPEVMVAVSVLCAESETDALDWSRDMAERRKLDGKEHSTEPNSSGTAVSNTNDEAVSDQNESVRHYAGTPEQVWARLQQVSRRLDTERLLLVTAGPDYERRLDSYRLLAEHKTAILN